MTLYFDTKYQFPPVGNPNVYYVSKRTATVYQYERGHYIKVKTGAENWIAPNYDDAPPPKPEFMIMFNAQGGTGGPTDISATVGTLIEQPADEPVLTGYIFQGWFDAPTDGNLIVWPYKLMENVYFYAQWVEDPDAGT
jgi:uncharacterized repeat protein (TIGR02543 family)